MGKKTFQRVRNLQLRSFRRRVGQTYSTNLLLTPKQHHQILRIFESCEKRAVLRSVDKRTVQQFCPLSNISLYYPCKDNLFIASQVLLPVLPNSRRSALIGFPDLNLTFRVG